MNNFFPPKERRRRQAKAFAHVQLALAIVRRRMGRGRRALPGSPLCSHVWGLIKDELPPGLIWVRRDQCAFDLRDDRGDLLQKPRRFAISAAALACAPALRRSRDHGRVQVQRRGGKPRAFSTWTTDLAERIRRCPATS
eukprot:7869746-Pyramimonas_sp.AAC.1